MKCPYCWADKAYARRVEGWRGLLLACLLLRPMKCHHCYHKFVVSLLSTIGKRVRPPLSSASPPICSDRPSYAAQFSSAMANERERSAAGNGAAEADNVLTAD